VICLGEFECELARLRVDVVDLCDDHLIDLLLEYHLARRNAETVGDFEWVTKLDILIGVVRGEMCRRGFSDDEMEVVEF
jgi:hypothetical protein